MLKITKTFFFSALFLSLINLNVFAQNADAVLGVWKNGEGTGMVQIYKKGDKYFGKLVWLKVPNDPDGKPRTDINNPDEKLHSRPLKGLENLRDFAFKGENKWEDGNIYDPKTGNDYSCEMKLVDENTLEVRGYIGVSLSEELMFGNAKLKIILWSEPNVSGRRSVVPYSPKYKSCVGIKLETNTVFYSYGLTKFMLTLK